MASTTIGFLGVSEDELDERIRASYKESRE
jgi:hypothetical protein